MKRAVVDTNVFISAIFWGGKPRQVIDTLIEGRASLL
jgi:predicted nucleic acid-binding protein